MNKPLTVVDYDAWNRGYMPPSEHVLIDKLAYRGARVQLSTPVSREHQMWVVIDGPPLTNTQRKQIREMVNLWFEDKNDGQERTLPDVTGNVPASKPYDPSIKPAADGSNACGEVNVPKCTKMYSPPTDTGSVT